jgi:hypothetical protein
LRSKQAEVANNKPACNAKGMTTLTISADHVRILYDTALLSCKPQPSCSLKTKHQMSQGNKRQ